MWRPRVLRSQVEGSKRRLPVAIGAFTEQRTEYTVELPPGAKVVSAPLAARADDKFGYYSVDVELGPQRVKVRTKLGVKVARVSAADYPAWNVSRTSVRAAAAVIFFRTRTWNVCSSSRSTTC